MISEERKVESFEGVGSDIPKGMIRECRLISGMGGIGG